MMIRTFCKTPFLNNRISKLPILVRNFASGDHIANLLSNHDPQQVSLLDEQCIVVDEMDKVIGKKSKKDCHIFENNTGILHRAFSVFLFNSGGDLLIQRRSKSKITFPGCFSNTCCSHPLYIPTELDDTDAIGVKVAAQRRLQFELGIPVHQMPLNKFDYLTRIHYRAAADPPWGEHELDYILFIRADVDLNLNLNEVSDCRYVSSTNIGFFMDTLDGIKVPVTPWFRLLIKQFLPYWWKNLDNLEAIKDQKTIHRL